MRYLDPEGEDERYAGVDRQPYVQVDIPNLVFVNSEARAVTMQWARARGISTRYRRETRGHVFARKFDPDRDVLYVSRDKWEEFCDLPFDETAEEMATSIRHLGLPAFTAYYSFADLGGDLMHHFVNLETLSAVWGLLPDIRYSKDKLLPRKKMRLLGAGLDSEDGTGTDTGVDAVTGEPREERIAVEVQPRWELEIEDQETVKMCCPDPTDGSERWEMGDLTEWMDEVEEALLTVEIPEHAYDFDKEKFTIEFKAVKAVRK